VDPHARGLFDELTAVGADQRADAALGRQVEESLRDCVVDDEEPRHFVGVRQRVEGVGRVRLSEHAEFLVEHTGAIRAHHFRDVVGERLRRRVQLAPPLVAGLASRSRRWPPSPRRRCGLLRLVRGLFGLGRPVRHGVGRSLERAIAVPVVAGD